ncbi:C-X-C chemokine receptor type 3.1 isoform X1 [Oncorhynchus nerka]|uniref:C-X-C chemokine receptor type 3.1 isoform X1 n=1 Tax=Oncorhynchus nerka TaxID=8023 RepID=UPI0011315023|nr:C-X-C chemokine receptor type 3-like isoform X1 [Oncorhynchus nerka]
MDSLIAGGEKLTFTRVDHFSGDYDGDYNETYSDTCCSTGGVCSMEEGMRFDAVFLPIFYSLTLVLGLLGNGLVLLVLVQRRRSWSVTDTFILHLGMADTLLLVTLPLWAVQAAGEWSFGTPLCKITGAMFTINFYCGIFLLACISLDRYLSVVHAVQMYSRRKPWMVQASCLSVWLLSFLLSIPDWHFLESVRDTRRDKVECVHNYPSLSQSWFDWRLASRLLYHTVGFLLPSAVLLFCYSCILLQLQRGSQGLQKQRAVRVILALVLVFFLCWTPYNITLMVDTLYSSNTLVDTCESHNALDISLTATSSLGYLHCSLNPVLYAFVGVKFRRHLLDMLRSLGCKLKSGVRLQTASRRSSMWSESGDTSHTSAIY